MAKAVAAGEETPSDPLHPPAVLAEPTPRELPNKNSERLAASSSARLFLVFQGVAEFDLEDATWVIPTHGAIWIPAGTELGIVAIGDLTIGSVLVIRPEINPDLPTRARGLASTADLRAIVQRVGQVPDLYRDQGPSAVAAAETLAKEIATAKASGFRLPRPRDELVQRLQDAMVGDPTDRRGLADHAADWGISPRTIQRRLVEDIDVPFDRWRSHLHALTVLRLLADGEKPDQVARKVGFRTSELMDRMVRRATGERVFAMPVSTHRPPDQSSPILGTPKLPAQAEQGSPGGPRAVTLTAPPTTATSFILPMLVQLNVKYPAVQVQLRTTSVINEQLNAKTDLVVTGAATTGRSHSSHYLAAAPFGLYSNHDYSKRPKTEWAFIGWEPDALIVKPARWLREYAGTRPFVFASNDIRTQIAMTLDGAGVSVLPRIFADREEGLLRLPIRPQPPAIDIWLLRARRPRASREATEIVAAAVTRLFQEAFPKKLGRPD